MTFPVGIKFKYGWRKYQARVLKELDNYLSNGSLHVVAPPGSGKTVLGLEVMLRLNRPTLILAPSLAIRDQWIDRFCELFLQVNRKPEWVSCDVRRPAFMTVCTYQGLHAACNNLDDDEEGTIAKKEVMLTPRKIANELKSLGVKTVILDEAHHLKNEWWNTLDWLKRQLSPTIVGLTATPPYDVTIAEWQRYIELNGTVDTEITVPELILEGDLCPHQDYVYFSLPSPEEYDRINAFRADIDKLFREIKEDPVFVEAISTNPVWVDPLSHLEWIFGNMSFYSAMLIFMHGVGKEVLPVHFEVIGSKTVRVPPLDYAWMEVLLDFYLHGDKAFFPGREEHQEALENKLTRRGAMERKQINFRYNSRLMKTLTASVSKLNSIAEIVRFESSRLEDRLRLVILTDYIRKEYMTSTAVNDMPLDRMGVFSVFEKLRREKIGEGQIGILTGSVVIVPVAALSVLEGIVRDTGLDKVSTRPLPYDAAYVEIGLSGALKDEITRIVTRVFEAGAIRILVGTKSLLGEGWDAPCINTLVLASFVGSFVSSNQMRGRAIRVEKGNDEKTGNIWHLVCVDSTSPTGGDDLELLRRRFRGFIGIPSRADGTIENGVRRLDIPASLCDRETIDRKNDDTLKEAASRDSLRRRWENGLKQGVNLVEEIKVPFGEEREYRPLKRLYLRHTLAYLFAEIAFAASIFWNGLWEAIIRGQFRHLRTSSDWWLALLTVSVVGFCTFGYKGIKAFRLYLKYRDISKDVRQIGVALLDTLAGERIVTTDRNLLSVQTFNDGSGAVYCHLQGGSTYEKSVFINAMQEIIGPVDNPRYVMIRESVLWHHFKQEDFHAVPEVLGRKKSSAESFKWNWEKKVGPCRLVFTRTLEGRKFLLHCRMNSLATRLSDDVERVNIWR